jgi:virulence-associated protein VapD
MPSLDDGDLKRSMLRMGIKSDEGYVYFNELLYRLMRRVYGNFKLGKQMQMFELKSQYKIFFLTTAVSKKSRVQ